MSRPRLHYFSSGTGLTEHLASATRALSQRAIATRGRFDIVLAGGSTPRALYQALRHIDTDWDSWHIYFGDERFLPPGHPQRNDTMADEAWLCHVPLPRQHIHRVPFADSAHTAAAAYGYLLSRLPDFDLVLLGLGEDGHTASLFPGQPPCPPGSAAIAVEDAPKPPRQRISLCPQRLSAAAAVWFMVTGEGKREALDAWLAGAPLPAASIAPAAGVDIFTDLTAR